MRTVSFYYSNVNDCLLQLVYHDDGPFLLTAESSLTELRQRLGDVNTESVTTMETFRPSIVIDGDTVPFDEVRAFVAHTEQEKIIAVIVFLCYFKS